jgi:hypothetical protein
VLYAVLSRNNILSTMRRSQKCLTLGIPASNLTAPIFASKLPLTEMTTIFPFVITLEWVSDHTEESVTPFHQQPGQMLASITDMH